MSSIELAKVYNAERAKYLLATKDFSDAVSKLKPYSVAIDKEDYLYAPAGKYLVVKLEDGVEIVKRQSQSILRIRNGLFLPYDLTDREYISNLLERLKEKFTEYGTRFKILNSLEAAISNSLALEDKNWEISEILQSINFEHKTQKQMKYLFEQTEEMLKEDHDGVVRAWLAYYPIKYTCYKVVL